MTDCKTWLDDIRTTGERILNDDLPALRRTPEDVRIRRYNEVKAAEEEFTREFAGECDGFLTESETARIRGDLTLARLLLAASFYDDRGLPRAMEGEFSEGELQSVVDFDRFRQFDVLDESQIEARIRRMEGEVYELVREYTSTQVAAVDDLLEDPNVQRDVVERLLDRYEDRRERIRQGFFAYVETHGLEHTVDAIEEAVGAVADATEERRRIDRRIETELSDLDSIGESGDRDGSTSAASALRSVEAALASGNVDVETLEAALRDVDPAADDQLVALETAIDRTREFAEALEDRRDELESARERAVAAGPDGSGAADLVDAELERLDERRTELRTENESLERERERLECARDRLATRREELERQVDRLESSPQDEGIDGSNLVSAATARLFEMDYVGRFDTSMHEVDAIELPDERFEVPEGFWEGRSWRRTDAPRMLQLLPEGEPLDSYPTNPTARYEITTNRYLGLSTETVAIVEATVYSDLESHADVGFDATPADVDDLLGFVNDAVREAERKDAHYLLGIASPTGWSERVQRRIDADDLARTGYDRRVSVCLVDLRDGSLVYDESDPFVARNAALFERTIDAERVADCVEAVRSDYLADAGRETLLLESVVDDHGFDRHVVKRTFERLEAEGSGEQFYVDDHGLALHLS